MTNWYQIFYWLTVADNVKDFLDTTSNLFSWFAVISGIIYFIVVGCLASEFNSYGQEGAGYKSLKIWVRNMKAFFYTTLVVALLTWSTYIFVPGKKDALVIIAGGTVGNFVTQDSSARQIPAEVMLLLRTKIKEEIKESSVEEIVTGEVDTLKDKSKEELLKIIKEQQ